MMFNKTVRGTLFAPFVAFIGNIYISNMYYKISIYICIIWGWAIHDRSPVDGPTKYNPPAQDSQNRC